MQIKRALDIIYPQKKIVYATEHTEKNELWFSVSHRIMLLNCLNVQENLSKLCELRGQKNLNVMENLVSSTQENDRITGEIIGAAIEVHRELGPGLLESIYEEALCIELSLRGINFVRQAEIDIVYKGRVLKGQRIDLIVEGEVIVELKSLSKLPDIAMAQTLSYLKAAGLKRGLIINFGEKRLIDGVKRVSN